MLVKELRQGMRANTFTAVFLGMQLLLGILLGVALLASESERTGEMVSGIIMTFFVICVVLIQPLRGMNALSSEMRDHTIDLMTITRLTAWRIVLGKWIAIVSQSALLFVTIIPYLLMRYFFGGMNLLGEMTILICLFATSMALTALTVGLSACTLGMVRTLLPIALLLFMFSTMMGMRLMISAGGGSRGFFGGPTSTGDAVLGLVVILGILAYLGHQALSMGTSLIAPAAENHAMTRRLITLVSVIGLVVAGLFEFRNMDEILQFGLLVLVVPAMVIALSESSHVAPGLVARYQKRGGLGKLAAVFLLPGPASGYFFSLLLVAMVAATACGVLSRHSPLTEDNFIRMLGLWGTLLFPAALMRFFHRGDGQRIGPYVLLLAASLLICAILQTFANVAGDHMLVPFAWCPVVFAFGDVDHFQSATGYAIVLIVMILLNLVLFPRALRDVSAMFKSATKPPSGPS